MLVDAFAFFLLSRAAGEHVDGYISRLARWADYERVLEFYRQYGADLLVRGPFEKLGFVAKLRLFNKGRTRIMIVEDGETNIVAAGMVSGRQTPREFVGEIDYILVAESFRGKGLSRRLMEELHEEAWHMGIRKLRLISEPHHAVARKLYESMGYQLVEGSDRHYVYALPTR